MSEPVRILALPGSLRRDSLNNALLRVAVGYLQAAGAEVDLVALRDLDLPLYDGDLETAQGLPTGAQELKRRIAQAEGLIIASPEYNLSIPGALKNAIDWASRGNDNVFKGKVAALMAASPGVMGGARMLPHLRQVLTALGVWLLPDQVTLPKAHDAFHPDGSLIPELTDSMVQSLAQSLVQEAKRRRLVID